MTSKVGFFAGDNSGSKDEHGVNTAKDISKFCVKLHIVSHTVNECQNKGEESSENADNGEDVFLPLSEEWEWNRLALVKGFLEHGDTESD